MLQHLCQLLAHGHQDRTLGRLASAPLAASPLAGGGGGLEPGQCLPPPLEGVLFLG